VIELKNINKSYFVADSEVKALKDVSITFRENEFVAILGPSGGGKTTLLNIIGGLDKYSSGDLIINGKSTKQFKDKDWDSYRNHSIGFVFQSYNLIPHQTVLANVELALTIAGISKKERTRRAKEALEAVGLADQCYKKPNQMSGGQMQRVAIARALVNNPDILLADEPTGALDSVSSVVIMDILKNVAKDRLVIMVTHNPELAQEYANRIVRIKDGTITNDSKPYHPRKKEQTFVAGKAKMSIFTAFALSLNNLLTKKGRTILVSFAGSIGIIGIAMILSLSNGVNQYIDDVQENSLSSYPLSIEQQSADVSGLIDSMVETHEELQKEEGKVTESAITANMFKSVGKNDLAAFKKYIEENEERIDVLLTSKQYDYSFTLQIYKTDTSNGIVCLNPSQFGSLSLSSYLGGGGTFSALIDNQELLEKQYELLAGKWPENYDEALLILQNKYVVTDYLLYQLGIRDQKELIEILQESMSGTSSKEKIEPMNFTYEDFLDLTYAVVCPSDKYQYNEKLKYYSDMSSDETFMKTVIENAIQLKVVGVVIQSDDASSSFMGSGIAYKPELEKIIIEKANSSQIVQSQLANPTIDVYTGLTFEQRNLQAQKENTIDFSDMIKINTSEIPSVVANMIDQDILTAQVNAYINSVRGGIVIDEEVIQDDVTSTYNQLILLMFNKYIENHGSEGCAYYTSENIQTMINELFEEQQAIDLLNALVDKYKYSYDVIKASYTTSLYVSALEYYNLALNNSLTQAYLTSESLDDIVYTISINENVLTSIEAIVESTKLAASLLQVQDKVNDDPIDMEKWVAASMKLDEEDLQKVISFELTQDQLTEFISSYMNVSKTYYSYDDNLWEMGYRNLDEPYAIKFYFSDFESKDQFKEIVDEYNTMKIEQGLENEKITYIDVTGILMSSITTIIDAISYVLIAFVSVSLIVSSIMIGIITYISVLERTKEIGVLRSLGASKKDVGNVFSAETFIIGLFSGLFGVGSTLLLCIPINMIIQKVTGISTLGARLPLNAGIVLVFISIILTLIGGLIPSKLASKCDPVTALRSE